MKKIAVVFVGKIIAKGPMIVTFIWVMTTHTFKRETKDVLKTPMPG